jgi:adenylate kinase
MGKVITVTGISGSGSKDFCEKYHPEGKKVKTYHTGDMIYSIAQNASKSPMPKENFLNLHPGMLAGFRDKAFEVIMDNLPDDRKEFDRIIVDTHAQFFWNQVYTNAYDWNYVNGIDSDIFITIIDKPSAIKARQMETSHGRAQQHDYRDLLLWQNVETNVTQGWAENLGKPWYVLPSKQDPRDIESLLFNRLLVYPSFPMTDADSETTKKIERFKERLKNSRIRHDGMKIPITDPAHIDVETDPELPEDVRETINAQTVHRDLNYYIEQATHSVMYYPEEDTPLSKGVGDESVRTKETGKFSFLITKRKKLSPFMYNASKIFGDEDEFFEYWDEHLKWALEYYRREEGKK